MSVIRELVADPIADPKAVGSVLNPYVLSHGTLECRSLYLSRKFYEEFLGFECAVHSPTSMAIRRGFKFHIVVVEIGDEIAPNRILNHWGIDMRTREEVDRAYEACFANREKYGIREIKPLVDRHGVYGFYFEDLDYNWWEVEYYPDFLHDDIFDFGDRYELKEPK